MKSVEKFTGGKGDMWVVEMVHAHWCKTHIWTTKVSANNNRDGNSLISRRKSTET
jgi:hypothetical protein